MVCKGLFACLRDQSSIESTWRETATRAETGSALARKPGANPRTRTLNSFVKVFMERVITNLRATFAGFVVAGCALILWFAFSRHKIATTFGVKTEWAMVICVVALMFAFAAIVLIRQMRGLSTDGDADAYYYLGFLYTLVTLIGTFAPLLSVEAKPTTQQVLGFFGLGLVTTFVGLAGRIFFLQANTAVALDAPDQLSAACLNAAAQLDMVTARLAHVAKDLDQIVTNSHQSVASALHKTAGAISAHTDRSHLEIASVSADAAKRIAALIEDSTANMLKAIGEVSRRLSELQLPDGLAGKELNAHIQQLATSIATAERGFTGLGDVVRDVGKAVPELVGAFGDVRMGAEAATAPLLAAAGHSEQLRSAVTKLVEAVEAAVSAEGRAREQQLSTGQKMTEGIAVISTYHDRLSQLSASLTQDLKASENAVRKVHQNLIEATEYLTQRVQ